MGLLRLQYVCVHGHPHEYVGDQVDVFARAATAMTTGETTAVVIEDNQTALEGELDALEPIVQAVGLAIGGYQPK